MAEIPTTSSRNVRKKCCLTLFYILLFAILTPINGDIIIQNCKSSEFTCNDGSCILQEKMCDGRRDCFDNSDESDCDSKLCRKPDWFKCGGNANNGPCISSLLMCNGVENCPSGEDEENCMSGARFISGLFDKNLAIWQKPKPNCSDFEYTCETDKLCIPLDFMCDGKKDCRDGSDEIAGCLKAEFNCTGFFCTNRKCLQSKNWICDGVDDCGDGSDELHCTYNCSPEVGKYACHDNATCLDLKMVCDGIVDCIDGSDESYRCSSPNFACTTIKCSLPAKCELLPTGPECICPKGYRYSTTQNVCVDINECMENYGACSQRCENKPGSYRCTCDDGYMLLADNRTCKAQGQDALLLYTTQVAVMSVNLRWNHVTPIARNLTKVIGVSYDGRKIYWTNIQSEAESIVKSSIDGKEQEILLTSGLDAPEDLAIDWFTDNIYFSDNVMRHIAVCSNDGINCVVLVTIDVHHPRGIALWPQRGQMFWTDWGTKPMIARAAMDGTNSMPIVSNNIHWPNGIALDMHNERIYWVDAKLGTMETARPDGSDRRVILSEVLKHPYGVGIFEDNIYWSDWGTKSIHMCNKFTGKNHQIITKDRTIYAVHVYHPSKQPTTDHACMNSRCSHLCLLAERNTSSCACPDGMQLSVDQMHCVKTYKKQKLFIGIRNSILEMEHTTFGRHVISRTHQLPRTMHINEMAYNNVNGSIFVADNIQRKIFEFNLATGGLKILVRGNLGNITGLSFDYLTNTLYWADAERHVVEVYSLQTQHRAIVSFFSGLEIPISITLFPEEGYMFLALRSRKHVHIDQIPLHGRGEYKHVFEDDVGDENVILLSDYETKVLYWSDSDYGRISFTELHNVHPYTFRGRLRRPYSLALVEDDLFWTEMKSSTIYWTHKTNLGPLKRIEIEASKDSLHNMLPDKIQLLSSMPAVRIDHPCKHSNGGCSHICVTLNKFTGACLCPAGQVFKDRSNRTCIEVLDCEFRCQSGECLTLSHRCNNRKDCPDGSDEDGCDPAAIKAKVICTAGEFTCHNREQCVSMEERCDGKKNCTDGSDEEHCDMFDPSKKCHRHQHSCENGRCVDFSVMCDGNDDCGDNSDEYNCEPNIERTNNTRLVCGKNFFQCTSGTCIAKSWECDGKLDCTDGSDEHDKCVLKDCPPNTHKCLLGQCVDMRLVCDGHNDCGDLSDETNCDPVTLMKNKLTCGDEKHPMFKCPNSMICLEMSAKCNGTAECPRGEDEADCGVTCSISEFQCKTTKDCIRKEFYCDHEKDCPDGSDELNCEHRENRTSTIMTHERPCEPHMFDCKDGQCIDMSLVCDGFNDCDTGADEATMCHMACSRTAGTQTCQHICRPTPTGAVCSCHKGYKLENDKRTCVDINECTELDSCAQICENTMGGFKCSCYPDFMLRPDKTTCKSIESESSLMFTTYNEVRSLTQQPITLRVVWSANESKINGFDINTHQRLGYFSTDNENVLYRVDLKTGKVNAGLSVTMPTKVAVDWITDNVYVISRFQQYQIEVCSFATKMCGIIIKINPRETIKTLAVDAYNRKLFFVVIHSHSFSIPSSQIKICNLDGKDCEILYARNSGHITAIATDPHKKMLYFMDTHLKILQSISYSIGSNRMPKTLIQKAYLIQYASGLSVYENQAFIVNLGSKEATRCNLYGDRNCQAFNLNILNAEDVLVDGVSRQPMSTNPCAMAKCSGMCIQGEHSYECMCDGNIVAENVDCQRETTHEITTSPLLVHNTNEKVSMESKHTSTAAWIFGLLFVAFIAIGIGYLYYRRIKQGHRDLNINLHFQNPLSSLGNGSSNEFPKSSQSTSSSNSTTITPNGSHVESESRYFGVASFQKLLRKSTASGNSEIQLETTKPATAEVHAFMSEQRTRTGIPNILVEEYNYSDATDRANDDDDQHIRLVPT